jgi:hypothetical protein
MFTGSMAFHFAPTMLNVYGAFGFLAHGVFLSPVHHLAAATVAEAKEKIV